MDRLWMDVRGALRMFRANPGLIAVAVLSLAIGIGPNSAIFSLIDAVGFRPLPIRDPSSLIEITSVSDKRVRDELSYPEYQEVVRSAEAFEAVAASASQGVGISGGQQGPVVSFASRVSGDYFATLGVEPVLGRTFSSDEDRTPGAHPVAIIGERLWAQRFGRDPHVLGRTIRLNQIDCEIIGVLPAGFVGTRPLLATDVWVPITLSSTLTGARVPFTEVRDRREVSVFARLKPGATLLQARGQLDAVAAHLGEAWSETNRGRRFTAAYEEEARRRPLERIGMMSLALVGLVLLIACANVAGLLLGRAEARRGEIAVRVALGATRMRLLRQLLTESVLLSLMAAIAGMLVTYWLVSIVPALIPATPLEINFDFRLDLRVLLFTALVALVAAPVFGLTPALLASRNIVPTLKSHGERTRSGMRGVNLRTSLVVGQIAVSLALLVASGLLVRSYFNTRGIDPGFVVRPMVFSDLAPGVVGYDQAQTRDFYRRLFERLDAVPGVDRVAMAAFLPLNALFGTGAREKVTVPGHQPPPGESAFSLRYNIVDGAFFDTMGIRVFRGRVFTADDQPTSQRVAIINQAMARRFWPDADPIDQYVSLQPSVAGGAAMPCQVVGIVQDTKRERLTETVEPLIYFAASQRLAGEMIIIMRGKDEPAMAEAFRRELRSLDRTMPAMQVTTMSEHMRSAAIAEQAIAALVSVIGSMALFLSVIGLYGAMAFFVARRTREIGIRIALGARPADVVRHVVRQGGRLAVLGSGLGLVVAAAAGRLMRRSLYGVGGLDALTFIAVTLTVCLVALAASYIPARRAARVDPMVALRCE